MEDQAMSLRSWAKEGTFVKSCLFVGVGSMGIPLADALKDYLTEHYSPIDVQPTAISPHDTERPYLRVMEAFADAIHEEDRHSEWWVWPEPNAEGIQHAYACLKYCQSLGLPQRMKLVMSACPDRETYMANLQTLCSEKLGIQLDIIPKSTLEGIGEHLAESLGLISQETTERSEATARPLQA